MPLLRRGALWLSPVLLMVVIFVLSAQPDLNSGLGSVDTIGRKLVHFAAFGLLCFLWWRAFRAGPAPGRSGLAPGHAALAAFLVTALYAVSDEYHQSFVQGRSGTALDVAIDCAGAALAALRLRARGRSRGVPA